MSDKPDPLATAKAFAFAASELQRQIDAAGLGDPVVDGRLAYLESANTRLKADNERLRAALAEILESFTEPEDDNDILRRARAALVSDKRA